MELAFEVPNTKLPACWRWRHQAQRFKYCCNAGPPKPNSDGLIVGSETQYRVRAIKQSLPTARERRWLSEQNICLDRSRGARYSRQESLSLAVWHLGIACSRTRIPRGTRGRHGLDNHELTSCVRSLQSEVPGETISYAFDGASEGNTSTDDQCSEPLIAAPIPTEEQAVSEKEVDAIHTAHSALGILRPKMLSAGAMGTASHDSGTGDLSLEQFLGIITWAYVVRVRATKFTMGKRAVIRNRAQRRVRAALRTVCPAHASRGLEYVVTVSPAALLTPFVDLVEEVKAALRDTNCWQDNLSEMETNRPRYNKR